ncbi:sensor histidine kinase [Mucilaginibacter sp. AW1-3]
MRSTQLGHQHIVTFKWHLIFWFFFIIYEVTLAYSMSGHFSSIIDYLTFYVLNIGLFYAHATVVFKNAANGKPNYALIAVYSVLEIAIYLFIKYIVISAYIATGIYKATAAKPIVIFIHDGVWRAVYFIGLSTAFAFIKITLFSWKRISDLDKQSLQNRLEQETLQKDLLASQYAFLKAQVNPHFLFNMLSFLHSNVYKYSEQLGDQIIHLADLMRYAFTEPESDGKVYLASEIAHVENYLSLNKIRFKNKLHLNLTATGDIDSVRIIPLVLITIIENIFKYGDLSDPEHPAAIDIKVTDDQLHLHISNRKIKRSHAFSSGIGMVNVQKRLDQAYPGDYEIKINQDELNYQLDLLIKVPENNEMFYN